MASLLSSPNLPTMGSSSSRQRFGTPETLAVQSAHSSLYAQVVSAMDVADARASAKSAPTAPWLLVHWLQMLTCLAETPIHAIYHFTIYAFLYVIAISIQLVLVLLDSFIMCFTNCKDVAAETCCRPRQNDGAAAEMVAADKSEYGSAVAAPRESEGAAANCFEAFLICLGRSLAHHFFLLAERVRNSLLNEHTNLTHSANAGTRTMPRRS